MENDIKKRVTELRKAMSLNQEKFAQKIGLTYSTISAIELGKNPLTEQNIKLICLTFGVSEQWLRAGAGPMFIEKDNAETPEEKELLGIFRRLSEDMKIIFLKLGRDLLGANTDKQEKPPEEKRAL